MLNDESRELRLFVSSTFRDLMPEREQLVKKVFPRIRKECRARGVEFTEIDLRWGITEEESRSGRTIRICLEEIDRCRPYFIGIIGSRYGWVPGITEIEKDAEMLRSYPWLRKFAEQEKSIIEMEFAHGAINHNNESAFFYEQHWADPSEESLATLKLQLKSSGLPYRKFNNPEELGEQVFADLLAILDRDFPAANSLTPLEHERIEHEAFARNRRRAYVAAPEYYEAFQKHIASDDAPLIIWGKSGLGKSALMSYLPHEYKERNPEAFIVQHFIGAAEGSDPEDVMRQVMMEIALRYNLSDEIPTDDTKLREDFPLWLAKVGTEKLVLFIDALNQLTGVARELHWLPDFIPPNVRLVLSTTEELPLDELRKRNWNELEMKPLSPEQVEKISETFLRKYSKSLTEEQLDAISSREKARSPLFLRTLLEEVRVFGSYSALDEHLAEYLDCSDERELFQRVLARMERDHGAEAVRSVMTAIWAARHGLSETEMMEITGLPRMNMSEMLIGMEYHLMQREEFLSFFHNYLREAVERRYVPGDAEQRVAHERLGAYFSTREFSLRRKNEEPWQWQAAGNNEKLKSALLEPQMIAMLSTDHERYEAFGYWRAFERVEIDATYIPRLMNAGLPDETVMNIFLNAIDLLILADAHHQAEALYAAGYAVISKLEMDGEKRLRLKEKEIIILIHLGKTKEVIDRSEEMLLDENSLIIFPDFRMRLLDHLAHARYLIDQFEEAERIARLSIDASENLYGAKSLEMKERFNNLAVYLTRQGRNEEAEIYFRKIIEIVTEHYGVGHPEVAFALMQFASSRREAGNLEGVVKDLDRAENILLRSLGVQHYYACVCRSQLAAVKLSLDEVEGARALLSGVIDVMSRKYPTHKDTATWGITLGYTYYMTGDYETALTYYERFLPRLLELLGPENPEVMQRGERMREMREKLRITNDKWGNTQYCHSRECGNPDSTRR